MTPEEYLKSKGHTISAIKHPQDFNLTISEINLFGVMEEYHQHKLKLLGIANVSNCDHKDEYGNDLLKYVAEIGLNYCSKCNSCC